MNKNGQLGYITQNAQLFPKEIEFFQEYDVLKISAGFYHSLVLAKKSNSNPSLFLFGKINNHQNHFSPFEIQIQDQEICEIACGMYSNMVLTSNYQKFNL